jgi:ubiquinone/menaquinone biosynthesis C-methylase UbiE
MPSTWAQGDYPSMARHLEPAAEQAVALAGIAAGERVLDVACGTGNAALAAARAGGDVDGIDLEPTLLGIALGRARAEGLSIHWHRGDAEHLDVDDGEFACVLSVFGAMYAPDHDAAARELARACAPGGRVVLAAWTPGSFMPAMGAVLAPYLPPPPPGGAPPSRWGDEPALSAMLHGVGLKATRSTRQTVELRLGGRREAAEFLVATAGHVVSERRRLQAEGRWPDLLADLSVLVAEQDRGGAGGEAVIELEYLLTKALPA